MSVLTLGLLVALFLVLVVVVDLIHLARARQGLTSLAESSALVGVQRPDLGILYSSGQRTRLVPNLAGARSAIEEHLDEVSADVGLPGPAIVDLQIDGAILDVTLERRQRLPFTGLVTGGRTHVDLRADAAARLAWTPSSEGG